MDVDEDDDELAPLKEPFRKPQLTRKYAIRYDLKLQIPPAELDDALTVLLDDALTVLLDVLKGIWKKLKETDKKVVIYPWKEASDRPALADPRTLSESLSEVQQYFDRAIPGSWVGECT